MEKFKKIVLKNGLKVILVPQPASLATTVIVLVKAGSKYETKEINGISHFLEHMCFKGTKKRPKPIDIASEFDGLGAENNAFTTREFTSYFAKVQNRSLDQALELVSDLYLNPTFDEGEIEKEKGVIIEEINMYEDLPQRKVQELFMEVVYGDQPAGWSVAGRKEVIKGITQKDFLTYRKAHYLPDATIVVVAGTFDEKKVVSQIEAHFATLSSGAKGIMEKVIEKQEKPKELIRFKASDQTHMVMGFRAFGIFDERRFALEVLADILGGGMSSRLFQTIREEMSAAYYVHAGADLYADHGLVMMAAGLDHQKVRPVISAALKEFKRFIDEPVSEKELQRAKDHLSGQLILSLETSDELGYFYGGEEVMNIPLIAPEEVLDRIRGVSAKDIQDVARALFTNERLNIALIGPFKDVSFSDIVKL